jgi:hypothetical protein
MMARHRVVQWANRRHMTMLLVCWLAGAATANGQILLTGEPGGKGAQSLAVTANLISPNHAHAALRIAS